MRWGLVPVWAKDVKIGPRVGNVKFDDPSLVEPV
jgi:putative SOS response-associated peptidase YedK